MEPVSLEYFRHDKVRNTLYISSEYFAGGLPLEISVKSHHTGSIVKFVVDEAAAEAAESWDGEMCEYIPTTQCRIKCLVVHHEW